MNFSFQKKYNFRLNNCSIIQYLSFKLDKKLLFWIFFLGSVNVFSQKKAQNKTSLADTLSYKRVFLTTHIYQNGLWISDKKVREIYKNTWQSKIKFRWASYMKPAGPVVAAGGIYLVYKAIKGVPASAVIEGKTYDYKIRSLPKLLIGLSLIIGGGCIVESSNELIQRSVIIYNQIPKKKKVTMIDRIEWGITPSNQIGFVMKLK
jgi:hypothetical protein